MHLTLQKTIDHMQKIEREFLLLEGIQQTEFDTVMSIDTFAGNNLMRKQRLATITFFMCG